ncbi:ArsR/SmtB family transcription factor [Leptospira wolffii]|uniref:ArsR/SmtB family transcription factor n=2 Tax=Leptospira wolffii TaxID=409998 RepID=A0ABV5BNM1_9LEPT|nr:ArsR family transcriptional regulator [Leptospira wolffii]TGK71147.1 ArsR family transcriptional regulator [Leptospira wolffii]TGK77715.1 ArsR family transcriptional regulator [Leptospira wolffii]TGL29575.1 ArsR family transcriptional regulator [Leptospira wolffii]TGL47360.1 ArsR family transcriptional regulator [Leptospira wolffii]
MVGLLKAEEKLDRVFAALSDSSRRQMLVHLRKRSLTISELAEPFSMSFAGVAKHIDVLTSAGLVRKVRDPNDGRSFRLELQNRSLSEASAWLAYHQEFWTNKLDRLEAFIEEQDHDRTGPKTRKKN